MNGLALVVLTMTVTVAFFVGYLLGLVKGRDRTLHDVEVRGMEARRRAALVYRYDASLPRM